MYAGKSQISYRAIKSRKFSKKRWRDVGTQFQKSRGKHLGGWRRGGDEVRLIALQKSRGLASM